MRDILIKYKLIDFLSIELDIERNDFILKMRENVIEKKINSSLFFDFFKSDPREYLGIVDLQGFEIKKRLNFSDQRSHIAIAKGKYSQNSKNSLLVDIEIHSIKKINKYLFYYLFLLIFYGVFFSVFINFSRDLNIIPIIFLIFHATMMFVMPIYIAKLSVKKLKRAIEKDIHFWTR